MGQAEIAAAVDNLRQAFEVAYNAANAEGVGALFTDDTIVMPPDAPDLHGRAAVVTYYQNWFDQFEPSLSVTTGEVKTVGDLSIGRGTWKAKLTPKAGGDALELGGKYMNLLQSQPDGSVKIVRHIWNMPPPPIEA